MKKLASVAMMFALTTFIAVAMTSAGGDHWRHWWGIHGNYEMVATGACLHSEHDFTFNFPPNGSGGEGTLLNPFVATPNGNHFISAFMGEGTWTFHRDGHGMMQVMQYCILPDYPGNTQATFGTTVPAQVTQSLMPSAPVPLSLLVDENKVPFVYEVDGSTITVVIGAPVGLTLVGKISSDHKTMTLQSALPVPPQATQRNALIGYYQICTITRTLTRMSDQDDD
jgi:hypothetical protein